MTMLKSLRMGGVAVALGVAACAAPPPPPPPMPMAPVMSGLTQQDQDFASMAAMTDLFEIQSSQEALRKSRDPRIRAFARRMVTDHTNTSGQMMALASKDGFTLPTALSPDMEQKMMALRNAKFSRFNRLYIDDQVTGHQMAVANFQSEAANGTQPDLVAAARQTLPMIQSHLDMAQRLR